MKIIFTKALRDATAKIVSSSDTELFWDGFAKSVESVMPMYPSFSGEPAKDVTEVPIEEYFAVTGMGGSYPPGQKTQRAVYNFPMIGSVEVFNIFEQYGVLPKAPLFWPYKNNGTMGMAFKAYSPAILTDAIVRGKIKDDAYAKIAHVETILAQHRNDADKFAQGEFRAHINRTIQEERSKRSQKTNALSEL